MRTIVLAAAMTVTFVVMRVYLHLSPNTDLNVAGYNVHHLFTGVVLLTLGGIPAVLLRANHHLALPSIALFGVGLSLTLDEWLYLIVTDGTNAAYITPVSFLGGLAAVSAAIAYAVVVARVTRTKTNSTDARRFQANTDCADVTD
jgi:hypothetical protein